MVLFETMSAISCSGAEISGGPDEIFTLGGGGGGGGAFEGLTMDVEFCKDARPFLAFLLLFGVHANCPQALSGCTKNKIRISTCSRVWRAICMCMYTKD